MTETTRFRKLKAKCTKKMVSFWFEEKSHTLSRKEIASCAQRENVFWLAYYMSLEQLTLVSDLSKFGQPIQIPS